MNGKVISSMVDRIANCNGSAEKELAKLIKEGRITQEEAVVIRLRASLKKMHFYLDSAIKAAG